MKEMQPPPDEYEKLMVKEPVLFLTGVVIIFAVGAPVTN
jgi:hypothetical protein